MENKLVILIHHELPSGVAYVYLEHSKIVIYNSKVINIKELKSELLKRYNIKVA